ncbi:hypothetical protein LCGC14_0232180 [marine sediment metagenome]|uniref:Methyltransferase FkbM domain-containing protein n=1 Tax=marine sediment metagenome TaxID=412755 RepID=A0A0F9UA86_9ZZZZ
MKYICNIWVPNKDNYFIKRFAREPLIDGKGTYQYEKIQAALKTTQKKGNLNTAIDVGAHIGLWTMHLARHFTHVSAFEPIKEHRLCFQKNVNDRNVTLYPFAIGEQNGSVQLKTKPGISCITYIHKNGSEKAILRSLDSFHFKQVHLIKIDCEGYEYFALKGAKKLIGDNLPIISIEQYPGVAKRRYGLPDNQAIQWLIDNFGYTVLDYQSGDFLLEAIR